MLPFWLDMASTVSRREFLFIVEPGLVGRLRHASFCPFVCPSVRISVNIYPGCLVGTTPLTVLYWSFWNFACIFFMVWRYACGMDIIVRSFLPLFHIVNLVIFHPQYIDGEYLLWTQLPLQFCTDRFETLHMFSSWYENAHMVCI